MPNGGPVDAARAAFGQSDVQLQGRDQKVSALSFHVTLSQMRPARCRCQDIGVAAVVVGDVLKRLVIGDVLV